MYHDWIGEALSTSWRGPEVDTKLLKEYTTEILRINKVHVCSVVEVEFSLC